MGQVGKGKIIVVVILFLLASIFVYGKPTPERSIKSRSLDQALNSVVGWKAGKHIPYEQEVVDTLLLDDYVNKMFIKDGRGVSLYIGYYLTTGKVGAAHDPLVCFPGQGWNISEKDKGTLDILNKGKISYSTMQVQRGLETSFLMYWFQAYDTANADTLSQKSASLVQKFSGAKGDNAFVRLTCKVSDTSKAECLAAMKDFAQAFYPVFLDYIRE